MIDGHKILGLIPARGGSKGIPRKNIRPLGGKPLIAWTIEEAKKSKYVDRLVVSTDDQEIAETAEKYDADVPFMRTAELASDTAQGVDVVLHALRELPEYDIVVLLQPTSPFRTAEDIDGAIELWTETGETVISVTEASKSPYWMYSLNKHGQLQELLSKPAGAANRQDLPKAYALNGSVYVSDSRTLRRDATFLTEKSVGYLMPALRSVDIDSEMDWRIAACLSKQARLGCFDS